MKPRISAVGMLLATLASLNVDAAPKVGEIAPELGLEQVLQAPAGTTASWQTLRGKVVVLEFWATWCAPCIAAIPHLNELADELKGKPVQFIAITDEDSKVVEPFLKKRPMRAWIGLDRDKSMLKAYGISAIPHTVIVNTNGEVAAITYPMTLKARAHRKPPRRQTGRPGGTQDERSPGEGRRGGPGDRGETGTVSGNHSAERGDGKANECRTGWQDRVWHSVRV